jgi:hypothetical protein
MPYICSSDREEFDKLIKPLAQLLWNRSVQTGELNYVVTQLLWTLWEMAPSYTFGSKLKAGVSGALVEFDRRKIGPYEDTKIDQFGDVLPLQLT